MGYLEDDYIYEVTTKGTIVSRFTVPYKHRLFVTINYKKFLDISDHVLRKIIKKLSIFL